jgi:DNA invertase Pin-like site-specific DNA recombinase
VVLLELFEKQKVALISVAESLDTGSAAGRLVITIMGAVSQWDREAIVERTRDAMRHKRSPGERVGNIAFGSRLAADGEHLEHDPVEQKALAEIRRLRAEGTTLRGIAAALNHKALRTRRGTPWRLQSVARVLGSGPPPPKGVNEPLVKLVGKRLHRNKTKRNETKRCTLRASKL